MEFSVAEILRLFSGQLKIAVSVCAEKMFEPLLQFCIIRKKIATCREHIRK